MSSINSINEQIKRVILRHFPQVRNRNLLYTDDLLERGILDSMGVLDLVGHLEAEFKICVSDDDLVPENFQTIHHLTAFVERKRHDRTGQLP